MYYFPSVIATTLTLTDPYVCTYCKRMLKRQYNFHVTLAYQTSEYSDPCLDDAIFYLAITSIQSIVNVALKKVHVIV